MIRPAIAPTIGHLSDRLVTLTSYATVQDAEVARGVLDAAGIDAMIAEEHTASIAPYMTRPGARLQVLESQAEAAAQILNDTDENAVAEDAGLSDATLPLAEPEVCPACGSPDVHRTRKALRALLIVALTLGVGVAVDQTMAAFFVMLAALAFTLVAPRWRCYDCSHAW